MIFYLIVMEIYEIVIFKKMVNYISGDLIVLKVYKFMINIERQIKKMKIDYF